MRARTPSRAVRGVRRSLWTQPVHSRHEGAPSIHRLRDDARLQSSLPARGRARANRRAALQDGRDQWGTAAHPQAIIPKPRAKQVVGSESVRRSWRRDNPFAHSLPDSESDESFPEVVEVRDPHHPLWGRSYRVIRKIGQRGRGIPASYEVEYRAGSSLLIQATAIEYYEQEANQIKLSMEALLELLSTADCPDAHEHGSSRSLVDADARAPTPDRRRRRRNFGGDPS
ncbi:hypothetical protein ABIF50_009936 [Bradyrhizobium diazoefficiens]